MPPKKNKSKPKRKSNKEAYVPKGAPSTHKNNLLITDQFTKLLKQISHDMNRAEELGDEKEKTRNFFRLKQIKQAMKVLKKFDKPILSSKDLSGVTGIGKGTQERIDEILKSGKLKEIKIKKKEEEELNQLEELESVYGIGSKTALDYYKNYKIKSVADLKKAIKNKDIVVNDQIKLGLKYFGVYEPQIPRTEMQLIEKLLQKKAKEVSTNLDGQIVGSYRRQKPTSNDIDFMMTHKNIKTKSELSKSPKNYLKLLANKLYSEGYIVDHITEKNITSHYRGFFKLNDKSKIRRIDLSIMPYNSYYTALMHTTGSNEFNIRMRKIAIEKKYKLNQYGLFKTEKGKSVFLPVKSEKDIFKLLGVDYIEPKDRD